MFWLPEDYEPALSSRHQLQGVMHTEVDHSHVSLEDAGEVMIREIVSDNSNGSVACVEELSNKMQCDPKDACVEDILVTHNCGECAHHVFSEELSAVYRELSKPLLKREHLWKREYLWKREKDHCGTSAQYQVVHNKVIRRLPANLREELERVISMVTIDRPTCTALKPDDMAVPNHLHELGELLDIAAFEVNL
ncbi:hypothetical protein VKT23_012052 [Stygiomarasmius scandens]|uniref:Uncharacterized protein n=1 Tax=Marasmiellus scandens TaxID=2682957 RepID=A0ABR1J7J3_9AGAR